VNDFFCVVIYDAINIINIKNIMPKYGPKSQSQVKSAMHKFKRGKLKSGRSGKSVKSRKQAIAIGLSEARKKGAKVPNASR
jgi:hypothetical protein